MHRYFPERSDLLIALTADADEHVNAAYERARLADGPASAALSRLCQELFELGETLQLLFNNPQLLTGTPWENDSESDPELVQLFERGRADGTLDPELDVDWAQQVFWALLYAAWMHALDSCVPKHTVLNQCLRTLTKTFGNADQGS